MRRGSQIILVATLLLTAAPAPAEKLRACMDALNGSDTAVKAQYVYYFTGIQDAFYVDSRDHFSSDVAKSDI